MTHIWYTPLGRSNLSRLVVCRFCGVILRADRKNEFKTCAGPVKIGLRARKLQEE